MHSKHLKWFRLMAIGIVFVLAASACKPKTPEPAPTTTPDEPTATATAEEEQTPATTAKVVDDAAADKLMASYMAALEAGDWETAQGLIWPYAETFEGTTGKTIENLRDSYQNLGYGTLAGGSYTTVGSYPDYTVYSVSYRFSPEPDADIVKEELITVVKTDAGAFISPNNLLVAYEYDETLIADASADTEETTTDDSDDDADDDDHVAPDEPLDGTEGGETVHQVPMAVDEAADAEGVSAQVTRAATYANGVYLNVEIDNASDSVFSMGSEDVEGHAVAEGVVVTDDPAMSVDLANDYGFALGNELEGALDSRFDTFAGQFEVPSKQKANSELFFTQDIRLLYNLYFPEITLGDNVRSLSISWVGLKPVEGGLSACAYLAHVEEPDQPSEPTEPTE